MSSEKQTLESVQRSKLHSIYNPPQRVRLPEISQSLTFRGKCEPDITYQVSVVFVGEKPHRGRPLVITISTTGYTDEVVDIIESFCLLINMSLQSGIRWDDVKQELRASAESLNERMAMFIDAVDMLINERLHALGDDAQNVRGHTKDSPQAFPVEYVSGKTNQIEKCEEIVKSIPRVYQEPSTNGHFIKYLPDPFGGYFDLNSVRLKHGIAGGPLVSMTLPDDKDYKRQCWRETATYEDGTVFIREKTVEDRQAKIIERVTAKLDGTEMNIILSKEEV